VLSKNRDRIVGAVYVSAETGPALVERLKKNLDVDVALLAAREGDRVVARPGDLDALPELIAQHTKEIETAKRTQPITMTVGKQDVIVVAAPFPGQAGEQQAYYALVGRAPANSGLAALFAERDVGRSQVGALPVAALAAGVFRRDRRRARPAAPGGDDRRSAGCGASCRSVASGTCTRSTTATTAARWAGWRATSTPRSNASRTRPRSARTSRART
jgi:hypothetical protein